MIASLHSAVEREIYGGHAAQMAGISAEAIHGDIQQRIREKTLEKFKRGEIKVLVATDVAARGLDTMLVAHNGPLSTILMMLLEMPNSAVNRLWFEQGCWSCVELGEGKARLLYFNK